ncbi:hypothetical protein ACFWMX_00650 [Streptomyces sp. NPDC058378]|uniref:hypothetical protein n=1 Tax=Streptomyces sp. NPDC058378 TaxID=3346469 RepID=UPI0036623EF1
MSCRGPDDRATWISGPAALGHRRLAIIDLPGGRQPMTVDTPTARAWPSAWRYASPSATTASSSTSTTHPGR